MNPIIGIILQSLMSNFMWLFVSYHTLGTKPVTEILIVDNNTLSIYKSIILSSSKYRGYTSIIYRYGSVEIDNSQLTARVGSEP